MTCPRLLQQKEIEPFREGVIIKKNPLLILGFEEGKLTLEHGISSIWGLL
jgi:hypothetical protein